MSAMVITEGVVGACLGLLISYMSRHKKTRRLKIALIVAVVIFTAVMIAGAFTARG